MYARQLMSFLACLMYLLKLLTTEETVTSVRSLQEHELRGGEHHVLELCQIGDR